MITNAFNTKQFVLQLDSGFIKQILDFVKMYCQEMMVAFGN